MGLCPEHGSVLGKLCDFIDSMQEVQTVSYDLMEELERYKKENNIVYEEDINPLYFAQHFADWQKQEMMKGAVDRVVFYDDWGNLVVKVPKGLKMNDKVKVIIIKEV